MSKAESSSIYVKENAEKKGIVKLARKEEFNNKYTDSGVKRSFPEKYENYDFNRHPEKFDYGKLIDPLECALCDPKKK
jgi:hypothetical protein